MRIVAKGLRIFFIAFFLLMLCSCSNNLGKGATTIKDSDFDSIIKTNNISLENFIETEKYLIVATDDIIIIKNKESSDIKEIAYEGANDLIEQNNAIFFLDKSNESICKIDYDSYEITNVFSSNEFSSYKILWYSVLENGNLWINIGECIGEENVEDINNEFIYNPSTQEKFELQDDKTFDDNAYKGVDYVVVMKTDYDVGYVFSRIYHKNKYFDTKPLYDPCQVNNELYYFFDQDDDMKSIYKYSAYENEEKLFVTFNLDYINGYCAEFPRALYEYNNQLYVLIGINQKENSSDYEKCEFWKLDKDGNVAKKYLMNEKPASSTYNFFDEKLYYYDIEGNLQSIDLT